MITNKQTYIRVLGWAKDMYFWSSYTKILLSAELTRLQKSHRITKENLQIQPYVTDTSRRSNVFKFDFSQEARSQAPGGPRLLVLHKCGDRMRASFIWLQFCWLQLDPIGGQTLELVQFWQKTTKPVLLKVQPYVKLLHNLTVFIFDQSWNDLLKYMACITSLAFFS